MLSQTLEAAGEARTFPSDPGAAAPRITNTPRPHTGAVAPVPANVEKLDQEISELKRTILELGVDFEKKLQGSKLQNFIPLPKQLEFFKQADKYVRAGYCGNRFGKSTLGVVEDCCWLLGYRPFFPEGNPLRYAGIPAHGVKLLVVAEDWEKVHEIFTNNRSLDKPGKFFEFLPESAIKETRKGIGGVITAIVVSSKRDGILRESIVQFDTVRSFINNPRSFESSDWDGIHIDEPVPKELWVASARGLLDRCGKAWFLLTPLGFPWMYDEIVAKTISDPDNYWWFEASMYDNLTLSPKQIELYLADCSEEEIQCRKLGIPLAHGRRVYGGFDAKRHVWQDSKPPAGWTSFNKPPFNYACGYALDPHPQTPHAVLFTAISPSGDFYIYDEIFNHTQISELAKLILKKMEGLRFLWQLCDPFAWIENPETMRCWADIFYEYGLEPVRASKGKTEGIIRTQEIWKKNAPRKTIVMPHCTNFLREIQGYVFDKENKPVDKNDHFMECLYRTVVHDNLNYQPVYKPTRDNREFNLDDANYDVPSFAGLEL
jgi:hypothetical protein